MSIQCSHGGKREGAGRKPAPKDTRKVLISATVSPEVAALLQSHADGIKGNLSATVEHFLRRGLDI